MGLSARAQHGFKLKGVIFERGSNNRMALAIVSNYRTKVEVGTNDMGFFEMYAKVGDTLLFTKRGFSQQEIVLKDTKDLVVRLSPDMLLNGVTVYGQSKKAQLDEIKKEYQKQGVFYGGRRNPWLLMPFGGHPLTFFYNLIGRRPKQARRFNKMYATEIQQSQIDIYFNKTTIAQKTGLSGKELDDFMVSYRPSFDQAKQWAQYDYLKWINDSFKRYKDSTTVK